LPRIAAPQPTHIARLTQEAHYYLKCAEEEFDLAKSAEDSSAKNTHFDRFDMYMGLFLKSRPHA
jgi:hypothetical protein